MRAEDAAHVAYEAQRALRVVVRGACMPKSWAKVRERTKQRGTLNAQRVFEDPKVTPKAIQRLTAKRLASEGWTCGPYDYGARTTPDVCDWDELTEEAQQEWILFVAIVRALASAAEAS